MYMNEIRVWDSRNECDIPYAPWMKWCPYYFIFVDNAVWKN
jgi:hypothetical protein